MVVSWNGGTPKASTFSMIFPYQPSISGTPNVGTLPICSLFLHVFLVENPIKMDDDCGYPYGLETSI